MNSVPANALIIGAYPPPIGGNSVHIQRLTDRLRDCGCEARVLDYLGVPKPKAPAHVVGLPRSMGGRLLGIWREARRTSPEAVVHVHVSAFGRFKWIGPCLLQFFRRQRRILTIHSGSFVDQAMRIPGGYLRWLCRGFDAVITVSDSQRTFLASRGLADDRLVTIPAYLPARANPALIPAALTSRKEGQLIVVTSGDLTPTYQYGPLLDCLERPEMGRHRFVFAFYGRSEPAYAHAVLSRLARATNAVVLRDQDPDVFVSMLAAADGYVRLTTTDGDAVAIREALALGRSVLASDVVQRPPECTTCGPQDSSAVHRWIEVLRPARSVSAQTLDDGNFVRILGLYRQPPVVSTRAAAAVT